MCVAGHGRGTLPGVHSTDLTGPASGELGTLAALAARCQADPRRHCTYAGTDADTIAAEVADVDGWQDQMVVARRDGRPIGWLLADVDTEVGRVWWWGPFVLDPDWAAVADRLYRHARDLVQRSTSGVGLGEELAADARSTEFAEFAARHGFRAEEPSACLVAHPPLTGADATVRDAADPTSAWTDPGPPPDGIAIVTLDTLDRHDREVVAALHDGLFAGSHFTGRALVGAVGDRLHRLVAIDGGRPVGYVAIEHQHDDSLYVDYLGVAPDARGRGVGRALVAAACREGFERGATFAHLTVRASNSTARSLYASLGFVEERVIAPARRDADADPGPG